MATTLFMMTDHRQPCGWDKKLTSETGLAG